MAFNFKTFATTLLEILPDAISAGKQIAAQVPNESKTQIATQSASVAAAVVSALDPALAPEVALANQFGLAILMAIGTHSTPTTGA